MNFIEALRAAQRGLDNWRLKPHNARWWSRIDGTPIPDDLLVCIAEEVAKQSETGGAKPALPAGAPQACREGPAS